MEAPDPNRRIKTNIESWRKGATQIVAVRHGSSGGVHAEMIATCSTPEAASIVLRELARTRPRCHRIYAFGPDEKSAIAPRIAIDRAVEDYLNGGENGMPGQLL